MARISRNGVHSLFPGKILNRVHDKKGETQVVPVHWHDYRQMLLFLLVTCHFQTFSLDICLGMDTQYIPACEDHQ